MSMYPDLPGPASSSSEGVEDEDVPLPAYDMGRKRRPKRRKWPPLPFEDWGFGALDAVGRARWAYQMSGAEGVDRALEIGLPKELWRHYGVDQQQILAITKDRDRVVPRMRECGVTLAEAHRMGFKWGELISRGFSRADVLADANPWSEVGIIANGFRVHIERALRGDDAIKDIRLEDFLLPRPPKVRVADADARYGAGVPAGVMAVWCSGAPPPPERTEIGEGVPWMEPWYGAKLIELGLTADVFMRTPYTAREWYDNLAMRFYELDVMGLKLNREHYRTLAADPKRGWTGDYMLKTFKIPPAMIDRRAPKAEASGSYEYTYEEYSEEEDPRASRIRAKAAEANRPPPPRREKPKRSLPPPPRRKKGGDDRPPPAYSEWWKE